jgi:hypothetical protein
MKKIEMRNFIEFFLNKSLATGRQLIFLKNTLLGPSKNCSLNFELHINDISLIMATLLFWAKTYTFENQVRPFAGPNPKATGYKLMHNEITRRSFCCSGKKVTLESSSDL